MQIEIKKLPQSEIEIAGEISAGDFESCKDKALKELSENVKIDGFRPGKVPEKILIEKIGEQPLLERMAEIALQKEYFKIIEEKNIHAVGRPEIIITKMAKGNPLGFKIKTAVLPEIELPDYKKIAGEITKTKEKVSVEEKEIDQTLEYLRKSKAVKNEKGEEILPELNDDFAKRLGQFENLESLRKILRQNIEEEKKIKAKEKKRMEILEKIIEASKMEVPRIVIEAEKNKMTEEIKTNVAQMGLKWEDYLGHLKKQEEELKNDYEKDAVKRSKLGLVLNKIAEEEKIEVSEDELNLEAAKIMEYYKNLNQKVDETRVRDYTYGIIRNEKVFQFLELC